MASPIDEQASTKASLKAWWSAFTKVKSQNKDKKAAERRVFGVPLRVSLKYASVAISMAGDDGNQYIWGYVPVVVAKVGLFLKENATEVEGVFRIAGSQKRMKELQETFDTPPRYGKSVDWTKYSVHDAASVLRRYLNHMPEPIVPLDLYQEFRNVMTKEPFDLDSAIKTYRLLITSSPPANQYLLLYVLDLLAVFARKADKNLMPASNLAVIFQPGMFSHPSHVQSPTEHKIAVEVLEFLITHQDHFVLGLSPPPPSNMTPEQLTAVSRPLTNENVLDPSDSDEDVGEFQVHEGGGARLGRSRTSTPKKSPGRAKRGAKDEGTGSVDSGPTSRASSRRSRRSGIGAEEIGTGAGIGNSGATGIRRSKTTPSRKGAGASAGAGATAGSSRIVSVEGGGTRPKSRRKSSGASTPASGSAQASPSPGSPAQLAPLTPVALASVAGAGRRETGSGPPSMATMDLQTQARSSVELGGSSREQKTPSSAAGAGTGAGEGAGAGAAVENVQGYPTPPSSKLLSRSDIGASASASGGGGGGGSGAASIAGEGRGSIEEVTRQYGGAPSTG